MKIEGRSIGRKIPNTKNEVACSICGFFKPISCYSTKGHNKWAPNCKPCEAERVAWIKLVKRINEKGILYEISAIQELERELNSRKLRFHKYTNQIKQPKKI